VTLTVEPLAPLGATIKGADIELLLHDESVPSVVMDALEANGVVVFPSIGFDDVQQIDFASRLGEVVTGGPNKYGRSAQNPEIYYVGFGDELNNALQVKGAFHWHMDGTTDDIPSKASLLSGRSLSTSGGGDTQFVSTYAAYDRLSLSDKQRLAHLKVHHSAESAYLHFDPNPSAEALERLKTIPSRVHPLVWTHRSGRKSLVLGTTAHLVEGMSEKESASLLADLLSAATEPEHVLTYEWSVGDLVIWDNRGTLHRATPYAEDSGRMMHRVTLVGDEPIE
jgi:alpha-ketoglutarate-dependent taurine dioxygenase